MFKLLQYNLRIASRGLQIILLIYFTTTCFHFRSVKIMDEMELMVERCNTEAGQLCETYSIGESVEGRDIKMLRVRTRANVSMEGEYVQCLYGLCLERKDYIPV